MKKILLPTLLALATATTAQADGHGHSEADKPSLAASRSMTMSAMVEAINPETREVTLKGSGGETVTITARPEVRNLSQVAVGDRVLAEVYEEVTIQVMDNPDGIEPGAGEFGAVGRAEEGEMPAGAVMDTVVITAVVEEINMESNTYKLRGPEGGIREFVARDPENLKKASVGDLVVITITQSMGVLVEHPVSE